MASISKAAQKPEGFMAFLDYQKANITEDNPVYTVNMTDVLDPNITSFFDMNPYGSFGIDAPKNPQDVQWITLLTDPLDTQRIPGFSEGFCFRKFRWITTGFYGDYNAGDLVKRIYTTGQKVYMAYAYVGPFACSK